MSDGDGSEEAVRVFVRIRPLNKRELAEKQTIGWNFNETSMLEDTPNGTRVYAFDHCFSTTSTNQETYDIVGKPVVLKAMEGYNGTVFTCKLCSFVATADESSDDIRRGVVVCRWPDRICKWNVPWPCTRMPCAVDVRAVLTCLCVAVVVCSDRVKRGRCEAARASRA